MIVYYRGVLKHSVEGCIYETSNQMKKQVNLPLIYRFYLDMCFYLHCWNMAGSKCPDSEFFPFVAKPKLSLWCYKHCYKSDFYILQSQGDVKKTQETLFLFSQFSSIDLFKNWFFWHKLRCCFNSGVVFCENT